MARHSRTRTGRPVSGSPNFAATHQSDDVGQAGDGGANALAGAFALSDGGALKQEVGALRSHEFAI